MKNSTKFWSIIGIFVLMWLNKLIFTNIKSADNSDLLGPLIILSIVMTDLVVVLYTINLIIDHVIDPIVTKFNKWLNKL